MTHFSEHLQDLLFCIWKCLCLFLIVNKVSKHWKNYTYVKRRKMQIELHCAYTQTGTLSSKPAATFVFMHFFLKLMSYLAFY